jgi:hypothetical protein
VRRAAGGALVRLLVISVATVGIGAGCSSGGRASTTTTTVRLPDVTPAQEESYFHDLQENVPSLETYVGQRGSVALDAILAYGAGFCELLRDGQDPSTAVASLQTQAGNLQSRTGFSGTEVEYEEIATDALIALCPAEESALSPDEQAELEQVEKTLGSG